MLGSDSKALQSPRAVRSSQPVVRGLPLCLDNRLGDPDEVRPKYPAQFGQHLSGPTFPSMEQRSAKMGLKLANAVAQRGLYDRAGACREREASFLRNDQEA